MRMLRVPHSSCLPRRTTGAVSRRSPKRRRSAECRRGTSARRAMARWRRRRSRRHGHRRASTPSRHTQCATAVTRRCSFQRPPPSPLPPRVHDACTIAPRVSFPRASMARAPPSMAASATVPCATKVRASRCPQRRRAFSRAESIDRFWRYSSGPVGASVGRHLVRYPRRGGHKGGGDGARRPCVHPH
jgi:hypothetical protein